MEVATALLDASRRLSSDDANGEKLGDFQQRNSWFGSWGNRSRMNSASDSAMSGNNAGTWISVFGGQKSDITSSSNNHLKVDIMRFRRNSSRDAEEAMAGGLTKADMYMPPM
eukprot:GFUD01042218.1.p1 GENE.GFUD01042218.1~~GFUD01042218.1.p1  ORF type:complete len:112 (-),score=36.69 GFUD01042218.1:415-750(-)